MRDLTGCDFLSGGGEMGARMRAFDWETTPLGHPRHWPQGLRVTVRLLLNTNHPMFIWWGPELIQFYNDAYRATMGPERHPSALGQRGRECWDEIWHIIGPQIEYVMAGRGATWNENHLVPVTRHGKREDVWWTYSYGPIDLDGGVGGVLVVCTDVTEQQVTQMALRDQTQRLQGLFEQAPGFIAVLRGPEHVFEMTNAAYRRLLGDREFVGATVREALPDIAGQGFYEILDQVYASGEGQVGHRVPLLAAKKPDAPPQRMMIDFVCAPIVESTGETSGIFVQGVDVTEHVRAEEHLQLVNAELKHRVKNTLAVIGAIASQTLRGSASDASLRAFQDRLEAFGKAHDILTATTSNVADIRDVVEAALKPHHTDKTAFVVRGQSLTLGSKQALSLALALHELSTNATKYGALSNAEGHVEVSWKTEGSVFAFEWREVGGPPVDTPTRKGFGSRLITRVTAADFGGEVETDYPPSGLVYRLQAPAENLCSPIEVDDGEGTG